MAAPRDRKRERRKLESAGLRRRRSRHLSRGNPQNALSGRAPSLTVADLNPRNPRNLRLKLCQYFGGHMRPVFVIVCLLLLPVRPAFAQADRGTITGTVTDVTSAVIPGVSVVATNVETSSRFETI